MNTEDLEQAIRIVEGTARSIGIEVVEKESDKAKVVITEQTETKKQAEPPKTEPPKENAK